MREVVIDTETTGLNFKFGDRITEVGCTELINHVATERYIQFYCSIDKRLWLVSLKQKKTMNQCKTQT